MSASLPMSAYRSYLLRFWQEHSEIPAAGVWRFSLEDPLTGRRQGFASLDALTAWIKAELAAAPGSLGAPEANPPG